MIKFLRLIPLFALIEAAVSFVPFAVLLSLQVIPSNNIPQPEQYYLVIGFCVFSSACIFWLIATLATRFFQKISKLSNYSAGSLFVIGLLFFCLGVVSLIIKPATIQDQFFIEPGSLDPDFFKRFLGGAWLQIWIVSFAAFTSAGIDIFEIKTSN